MHDYSKITIEIDDYMMKQLKTMAEESGYDDVNEYATELFNDAMYAQNNVEFIISLPNVLVELLDRDIKTDGHESRSDVITFILRTYYFHIGRS